ncbi:alpha/beta fold hydrolase [Mesorhizobium sp. M0018]|uniref:alpha/beta fold hydrolase n=1 Tax=unclassified Mesorhizobium TaxID=325217 RepID=UPI00333891AE
MPKLTLDGIDLGYEVRGDGPPVLFVHGSVTNGMMTWSAQLPLAERWKLVVVDRPGYGSSSPAEREDFAVDAGLVAGFLDRTHDLWDENRVHLVGHSYGGVISLLAAAMRPRAIRSLTVIEPPAFDLARGDVAVNELVTRLKAHWQSGPRDDPALFLRQFLHLVGSATQLPDPLPPPLAQGAAMLVVERGPWEAEIPLRQLADAPFPKLVVSGGHSAAFDAVCDVLENVLGADRAVIAGAGHSVQQTGEPFNRRLGAFMAAAEG